MYHPTDLAVSAPAVRQGLKTKTAAAAAAATTTAMWLLTKLLFVTVSTLCLRVLVSQQTSCPWSLVLLLALPGRHSVA